MPVQKLKGGKWYCDYQGCFFLDESYEVVRDHEMSKHFVPMMDKWNSLLDGFNERKRRR